jgi:hypothetical protein
MERTAETTMAINITHRTLIEVRAGMPNSSQTTTAVTANRASRAAV